MAATDIRLLSMQDIDRVRTFDDLSGNYLGQWIEDNEDYAWGLFLNDELAGYCSIGYADDCRDAINSYPGWTMDSLLLSDVFVHPQFRHRGLALQMIDTVIRQRNADGKELVFLTLLHDGLSSLYEKAGFSLICPGVMVKDARTTLPAKKGGCQKYE